MEISVAVKMICGTAVGFEILPDDELQPGCSWAVILNLFIIRMIIFESSGIK